MRSRTGRKPLVVRMATIGVAMALAGALIASPAEAQVERFTGVVSSTGDFDTGLSQFRLNIEKYSTDEEGDELSRILTEEGWQKLEDELLTMKESAPS